MKVMSFDQSTKVSGWSLFKDGEYACSGVIDMEKNKLPTSERSFEMAKRLWTILKEYKPDHLIIEDTQQQSNVKTVIILARLQGMIIGYAEAHKVQVHIVTPSQWRAQLNYKQGPKVKRAELKQQSADYIKDNYGITLSEDENEAICINAAAHKLFHFIEDDIWGE